MSLAQFAIKLLFVMVVGGHIAMWMSDMPRELALKLTLINAVGWAAVLVPAYCVAKWAAIKRP